jgi:hypothetical protein
MGVKMLKKQVLKKIDNFYNYVRNRHEKFMNISRQHPEEDCQVYLDMDKFFNDLVYKITIFRAHYDLYDKLDFDQINVYLGVMNNSTHTSNHYKRTNLYRIKNKWMTIKQEINSLLGDD